MAPTNQAEGKGIYAILEKLLRATNENKPLTCTDVEPVPDKVSRMPDLKVLKSPLTKPNVTIIEDENEIVLDFAEFTITVRSKKS